MAIFKKELHSFFNSSIGYLILFVFLGLNGLFLWVFRQQFNVFDNGFADLGNFFLLIPWVFLFLVPAITMRSISEEKKMGTWELLLIKPIPKSKIILGKLFGVFMVGILALVPTLIYIFAISDLGIVRGNYDLGLVLGSYFGTLFLLLLYCSIGIFVSSQSNNQIFAFILSAALCFVVFFGPEAISTLFQDGNSSLLVKSLGAKMHFEDISKGVLDTRDIVYFLSLSALFVYMAISRLSNTNVVT